jgi:hypothetical protein
MTDEQKEIIKEYNERARGIKAINLQREVVERAEHDLLVLISLKRAQEGRTGRFPFKFSNQVREKLFVAYIEDHTKIRAGYCLVIDHYRTSLNYFSCDVRHAEGLKEKVLK